MKCGDVPRRYGKHGNHFTDTHFTFWTPPRIQKTQVTARKLLKNLLLIFRQDFWEFLRGLSCLAVVVPLYYTTRAVSFAMVK